MIRAVLLGVLIAAAAVREFSAAEEPRSSPGTDAIDACPRTALSGEVSRDQPFQQDFSPNLTFRLRPNRDPAVPGWTIEVVSKTDPGQDLVWVVTPPYRFWNPRYLDVSYGLSAKDAVSVSPRDFNFVLSVAHLEQATAAVRTLLWSYGHSEDQIREAHRVLDRVPRMRGRLRILAADLADTGAGGRGRIESMKFDVDLCLPSDPP